MSESGNVQGNVRPTHGSPPPVFGVASIQGGMSPQFDYSVTLRRISVLINVLCKLPHFIFLEYDNKYSSVACFVSVSS